ncbi:MAG: rod-binding protein [Thermodesulfobacteriota bacterium]
MKITTTPPLLLKKNTTPADTLKEKKLRQACADFEAIILEKNLRLGRESVPGGGILGGGFAEEMYRSMYDHELAKKMSQGKGMGFGETLYRQIRNQHPIKK